MTTAREIDAIAAEWAARIDRGPLTAAEDRALALWMDSDIRSRGALMRMRAIALHSERARGLGPMFVTGLRRPRRWRALVTIPAAAAAACAVAVVAFQFAGSGQGYETRQGEVRVVPLDDGTVMTLNTASDVEVSLTGKMRKVRLVEGEVLFDVAKDSTRPFIVTVGTASVRAVGTSFTVRRLGKEPIRVIVQEGVVELQQPKLAAPVRVTANMRAELPAAARGAAPEPKAIGTEELNRELAWRDGRIAFEAESLARAAAAFARYSEIRIVIDDPAVARQQITGLFTANDPIGFARAAAATLGLKADVRGGEVRLGR